VESRPDPNSRGGFSFLTVLAMVSVVVCSRRVVVRLICGGFGYLHDDDFGCERYWLSTDERPRTIFMNRVVAQ